MSQIDASINDVLNIKDTIGDLVSNDETDNQITNEEKQFKDRMEKIEKLKKDLTSKDALEDEEFVKATLKKIMNIGVVAAESLSMELEAHPDGRGTECLATVLNAVTTSAKELNNVNTDKEKIKISRETLDMKKLSNPNNQKITQNNNFFGNPSDILDLMKKGAIKTVDVDKIT